MTLEEMYYEIEKIERFMRRGLLLFTEAQDRIIKLIEKALPEDDLYLYSGEEKVWYLEQRRQAYRRMWQFLLDMTKDQVTEV